MGACAIFRSNKLKQYKRIDVVDRNLAPDLGAWWKSEEEEWERKSGRRSGRGPYIHIVDAGCTFPYG